MRIIIKTTRHICPLYVTFIHVSPFGDLNHVNKFLGGRTNNVLNALMTKYCNLSHLYSEVIVIKERRDTITAQRPWKKWGSAFIIEVIPWFSCLFQNIHSSKRCGLSSSSSLIVALNNISNGYKYQIPFLSLSFCIELWWRNKIMVSSLFKCVEYAQWLTVT